MIERGNPLSAVIISHLACFATTWSSAYMLGEAPSAHGSAGICVLVSTRPLANTLINT